MQFVLANATKVTFADRPLTLPRDYRYADATPLEVVSPKVLWGEVPRSAAAADGRERFAAWVVAHDNRQFARTIANRMWRKIMGVGLVEPVDDFREENPSSDPALLEHLTDLMLELDFDLREFVRVLVSTDVWQRRAVAHDPTAAEPFRFPGPALRRMTAEQVWDSILTLVARNPWSVQRPTPERIAAAVSIDIEHADAATVERAFDAFLAEFGPGRYQRSLQQVCGYQGQLLMRASEMPTPLPLGTEFGRSPTINENAGRDHHPAVFSCLLAGAGIKGGVVHGASDARGHSPDRDAVTVADFNTTIAAAMGLPHAKEFHAPNGRPFKIGGGGTPIAAVLT